MHKNSRRVDIRAILQNPAIRRDIMAHAIQATQAREGINTTLEQAYAAYDHVQAKPPTPTPPPRPHPSQKPPHTERKF